MIAARYPDAAGDRGGQHPLDIRLMGCPASRSTWSPLTIPILLIVVGSDRRYHLLAEFRHAQRCGDAAPAALRRMARRMVGRYL